MKGIDYFKERYANVMNRLVIARDVVTEKYHSLAELIRRVDPPISEQMNGMLIRHDKGLTLFVVGASPNHVQTLYRPAGSEITTILTRKQAGDQTTWRREEVVTRHTLPDGRWVVNPAYLTPPLEEMIPIREQFELYELERR